MVTIELALQLGFHFIFSKLIFPCHLLDLLLEDGVEFLLGDAEQGVVSGGEADVVGLVETAEHTDL